MFRNSYFEDRPVGFFAVFTRYYYPILMALLGVLLAALPIHSFTYTTEEEVTTGYSSVFSLMSGSWGTVRDYLNGKQTVTGNDEAFAWIVIAAVTLCGVLALLGVGVMIGNLIAAHRVWNLPPLSAESTKAKRVFRAFLPLRWLTPALEIVGLLGLLFPYFLSALYKQYYALSVAIETDGLPFFAVVLLLSVLLIATYLWGGIYEKDAHYDLYTVYLPRPKKEKEGK